MSKSKNVYTPSSTALVITDPQIDFLSPDGVTWGMVGESVTENNTVENIESLFIAAKENGYHVFISPHYYYPTDHGWAFEGTLEQAMHDIKMFDRKGPLNLDGFEGSGADWMEVYKPYINDGKTIVVSPHKVYKHFFDLLMVIPPIIFDTSLRINHFSNYLDNTLVCSLSSTTSDNSASSML